MTRIVAGAAGGRRLATPTGSGTRPTSERVREALFSRLEHLGVLPGARVLDLYAGSGALGLEAASRGAATVLLVEQAHPVAAVARRNALEVTAAVRAAGGSLEATVRAEPVARVLAGGPGATTYEVVLLDPPYALGEEALAADLAALVGRRWLGQDAVVVVERSSRAPEPRWPDGGRPAGGLTAFADRRYGETTLWYAEPTASYAEPPQVDTLGHDGLF